MSTPDLSGTLAMVAGVVAVGAMKEPVLALAEIHRSKLLDGLEPSKEVAAIKAIAAAAYVLAEVVDEQRAAFGITSTKPEEVKS